MSFDRNYRNRVIIYCRRVLPVLRMAFAGADKTPEKSIREKRAAVSDFSAACRRARREHHRRGMLSRLQARYAMLLIMGKHGIQERLFAVLQT